METNQSTLEMYFGMRSIFKLLVVDQHVPRLECFRNNKKAPKTQKKHPQTSVDHQ